MGKDGNKGLHDSHTRLRLNNLTHRPQCQDQFTRRVMVTNPGNRVPHETIFYTIIFVFPPACLQSVADATVSISFSLEIGLRPGPKHLPKAVLIGIRYGEWE